MMVSKARKSPLQFLQSLLGSLNHVARRIEVHHLAQFCVRLLGIEIEVENADQVLRVIGEGAPGVAERDVTIIFQGKVQMRSGMIQVVQSVMALAQEEKRAIESAAGSVPLDVVPDSVRQLFQGSLLFMELRDAQNMAKLLGQTLIMVFR